MFVLKSFFHYKINKNYIDYIRVNYFKNILSNFQIFILDILDRFFISSESIQLINLIISNECIMSTIIKVKKIAKKF